MNGPEMLCALKNFVGISGFMNEKVIIIAMYKIAIPDKTIKTLLLLFPFILDNLP